MYSDDDLLMLSGIQHFRFCPRQWALIHIEQLWEDNRLTMEGSLMHQHADDPFYRQKCGNYIGRSDDRQGTKDLLDSLAKPKERDYYPSLS